MNLPTDAEIDTQTELRSPGFNGESSARGHDESFSDGAIWMRDTYAKPLAEENEKLKFELKLAIEHDRQPYPTAWAYEQRCKENQKLEAALDIAVEALKSVVSGKVVYPAANQALKQIQTILSNKGESK